ncbi:MAG: hypothetical protein ACREU3_05490 [Steroidobacteraceae bacterium]
MKGKRTDGDVVDRLLEIAGEMRKRYRIRQTVHGPKPRELRTTPPRGMTHDRKSMLRWFRNPHPVKRPKPLEIAPLVEYTSVDGEGRSITRRFGDPRAWTAPASGQPVKWIKLRGAARNEVIRQMHAAGLSNQRIADTLHVAVKTVERALKGKRQRARTKKKS